MRVSFVRGFSWDCKDISKAFRKGYTHVVSSPGALDKIKISVEISLLGGGFAIVNQTVINLEVS
jgi:hypothetical protein